MDKLLSYIDFPMNFIETDRLILRSWKQGDLPLFAKMNKDSRVMRCFPATLSDAETEAFTIVFRMSLTLKAGDYMQWK